MRLQGLTNKQKKLTKTAKYKADLTVNETLSVTLTWLLSPQESSADHLTCIRCHIKHIALHCMKHTFKHF